MKIRLGKENLKLKGPVQRKRKLKTMTMRMRTVRMKTVRKMIVRRMVGMNCPTLMTSTPKT